MANTNTIRLNKYLANAGIISRRKSGDLIKDGNILVNGEKAKEPGQRINPDKDIIEVFGKKLSKNANFVYIALNKPLNVVSTTKDEKGRRTVVSLVNSKIRLYPVGRLDADSIGLILLTNDGELTHKLTHPKFHIPKKYEVVIKGQLKDYQLDRLRKGVILNDGITLPAEVKVIENFKFTQKLEFIIHEGRNRQIRRMIAKVGSEVLELKRVSLGEIELGDLKPGKSRNLTEEENAKLKKAVGLS